jgi:hypothetical protein
MTARQSSDIPTPPAPPSKDKPFWGARAVRPAASILALVLLFGVVGTIPASRALAGGEEAEPAPAVGEAKMRLLTEDQYRNSIAHVFGPDIVVKASFPSVRRSGGLLALGASKVGVTVGDAEMFQRTAQGIAAQAVDIKHRDSLVPCRPKRANAADPVCAREFLASVGRLLYRRSLTEGELLGAVSLAGASADKLADFYAGLTYPLAEMLYSPNFLFAIDDVEPDPNHPGQKRVTGASLATRLSLLLWNSIPDEQLLTAAERGKLYDPRAREKLVAGMIASPRFEQGVRAFFGDMLGLDELRNVAKDVTVYPRFTGRSVPDAAEQTLKLIVDHTVDKDADYRALFTTRTTFVSPDLASLYDMPAPASGWARVELPADNPRRGLLMQVAFLAEHSHPARTSPTLRGRAFREQLLCQKVPDPPPNIDSTSINDPTGEMKTLRERLSAHRANPVCAGCHRLTDPIGLALENFDGAGQYRTQDNGVAVNATGQLDNFAYDSPVGLAQAVHDHPETANCLVKRVVSYGLGRELQAKDGPTTKYFISSFMNDGYRVKALMRRLALSRAMSAISTDTK